MQRGEVDYTALRTQAQLLTEGNPRESIIAHPQAGGAGSRSRRCLQVALRKIELKTLHRRRQGCTAQLKGNTHGIRHQQTRHASLRNRDEEGSQHRTSPCIPNTLEVGSLHRKHEQSLPSLPGIRRRYALQHIIARFLTAHQTQALPGFGNKRLNLGRLQCTSREQSQLPRRQLHRHPCKHVQQLRRQGSGRQDRHLTRRCGEGRGRYRTRGFNRARLLLHRHGQGLNGPIPRQGGHIGHQLRNLQQVLAQHGQLIHQALPAFHFLVLPHGIQPILHAAMSRGHMQIKAAKGVLIQVQAPAAAIQSAQVIRMTAPRHRGQLQDSDHLQNRGNLPPAGGRASDQPLLHPGEGLLGRFRSKRGEHESTQIIQRLLHGICGGNGLRHRHRRHFRIANTVYPSRTQSQ